MQTTRLPFFCFGIGGQAVDDRVLVIRRDPLQAADRDRLLLDPAAPAGGLAGAVADPAEDPREHVRLPVDHVRIGELPERDQADVLGDVGVRGTGPLAVDDPVEIVRVRCIGRLHAESGENRRPQELSGSASGRNRSLCAARVRDKIA